MKHARSLLLPFLLAGAAWLSACTAEDLSSPSDTAATESTPTPAITVPADTDAGSTESLPHDHAFGDWVPIEPASCTAEGRRERTCPVCGETESQPLSKTAHAKSGIPAVAPTLTENGLSGGMYCTVCGQVLVEPSPTPYVGHTDLSYDVLDRERCIITGRGSCDAAELYIPAVIDGYRVVSIAEEAFFGDAALTALALPMGLNSIGSTAFACCPNLATVTFPDSLLEISPDAFSNCPALTRVALPDDLLILHAGVFSHCTALSEVTLPDKLQIIHGNAFYGCTALTRITLPAGASEIRENAFDGCTALTEICFEGTEAAWNAIGYTPPEGVAVHVNTGG